MIIYEIPKNHKLYNEHIFYIGNIYKDIYFLVVNKKVDQKIIKKMINESLIFDNYNSTRLFNSSLFNTYEINNCDISEIILQKSKYMICNDIYEDNSVITLAFDTTNTYKLAVLNDTNIFRSAVFINYKMHNTLLVNLNDVAYKNHTHIFLKEN